MEKTKGELLKEQLFNNAKDATVVLSEEEMKKYSISASHTKNSWTQQKSKMKQ